MDLTLGGVRVASPSDAGPTAHVAVPVTEGRVALGRVAAAVGVEALGAVQVVAGLRSACWVGPPGVPPPDLGRLAHPEARAGRLRVLSHPEEYRPDMGYVSRSCPRFGRDSAGARVPSRCAPSRTLRPALTVPRAGPTLRAEGE